MSIEKDKEFVSALLARDNAAWVELSKCIESWLRNASARHYIPQEDILDLRQEILEKFLENNYIKLQQFSFRCRLSSWIGSVVNNHLFDHYTTSIRRERREKGFENFKSHVFETETGQDSLIDRIDSEDKVEKALDSLTQFERRTVRMIYWDCLTVNEISKITGEKSSSVTSRLSRARGKLRDIFLEEEKGKGEKAI